MTIQVPNHAVDLGSGHWITWFVGAPHRWPTDDERFKNWKGGDKNLIGVIEWHWRQDTEERELCSGTVYFLPYREHHLWTVKSLDPLDIEPSIWCKPDTGGCGSHGHIREGKWQNVQ